MRPFEAEQSAGSVHFYVKMAATCSRSYASPLGAAKKKRRVDVYRPGGEAGRPNRATIQYTAQARHHFPDVPVIIGGLEAGPRRLAYYDYWDDKFRRSILVDSKADLLVWGMGERQTLLIAERLAAGDPDALRGLEGTCELVREEDLPEDARRVPSFEELRDDPSQLIELFHGVREENQTGDGL